MFAETTDPENKASSSNGRGESRKNGRILCYTCGGNGAYWSLFSKENDGENSPYFPFLRSIEKAEGAEPMRSNGRIDACTLCFSFLVQQWHSYEESDTPVAKRTYWLKRSGTTGNEPFKEDACNVVESSSVITDVVDGKEEVESIITSESGKEQEENNCVSGSDKRKTVDNKGLSSSIGLTENNSQPAKQNKCLLKSIQNRTDTEEVCCSCGELGERVPLKTVHTKPQLRTETPFYPLLAQRSENIDFMGKVFVCKTCEVCLLKQWQSYEKRCTVLSDRHYTLPFESGAENVSTLSFVCFICGKEHPKDTAKQIHASKGKHGMPYFPFLLRCLPAVGAKPIAETGSVEACESCHHSLTNQWDAFEDAQVNIHEREYDVKRKHRNILKRDNVKLMPSKRCSICDKLKSASEVDYIQNNKEKSNKLSGQGRTAICFDCKKLLKNTIQPNHISQTKPIDPTRRYDSDSKGDSLVNDCGQDKQNKDDKSLFETCFLCGEKVSALNLKYLHVFPRQYVNGFKPFFPSLAYRVPAYHAKPPSTSGIVMTCVYCHGNMMNQWQECEKREKYGISNPWVRQYIFSQFACYLCGKLFPRQKITAISSHDFPFLSEVRRPANGFRINHQKDYVVCQHCKEIVHIQKENFDKCKVEVNERDYELPMVHLDSNMTNKSLKRKASESESNHPVVVIGDSEPEEDAEVWKREEGTSVSNVVTSSRTSTNTESLHVNTTQTSSAPMSSPGTQNSSFAAALRKLAKQAMSPSSQSPVNVLPSSSNMTMSPVKNNGCESPKLNGTPAIVCKKEVIDSNFMSSKENRGHPNLPSSSELGAMPGHQVVPGVFSLGPRGFESKPGGLEDLHGTGHTPDLSRVRAVHPPPPSHPFYMPFLQRPAMPDSMYLPPFPCYPPGVMEPPPGLLPPGFDQEVWRKRRALEHMRQQHERHAQFFPPHERPLYIMDDHLNPLSVQASMSQRPYAGDVPPRGEKSLGKNSPRLEASTPLDLRTSSSSLPKTMTKSLEVLGARSPSSRDNQLPVSSSFLRQSHAGSIPAANAPHTPGSHQTSLRSPSRDEAHTERDSEREKTKDNKQREHQIMWTRRMFEQKRRLRQEEIEWQHRQQQVRQQKREVQQELYQFRQKLLQQKDSEKDDTIKSEQDTLEPRDEVDQRLETEVRSKDGQRGTHESKIGLPLPYGYPMFRDNPHGPQPLHLSNMFPRLPHHDMFYSSGYLPQAPLSSRMDTRMYKEYLQQPTHFMHDSKSVSEWLQKQKHSESNLEETRERLSSNSMFMNGEIGKDSSRNKHEPQKLKFMEDLGLMTVSEKRERSQTMLCGGKRKYLEDLSTVEDESNKENRVENGEVSAESGTKKDSEEDTDTNTYCSKKVEFLFKLGLVTPRKRKELEDDFEKSRWERRTQRLQRKSRKKKKEKKDEKIRSRTPLDLDVSGPMTRQKQQLLQEYGLLLPIKDAMEKESSSSPDSSATADRDSIKGKDSPGSPSKQTKKSESPTKDEETFHKTYEVSTPTSHPPASSTALSSGPQLTLQSLTHMENPYRSFASAFHPPFYHSGLLSVHQDPTETDSRTFHGHESPRGNESMTGSGGKRYSAVVPGSVGVYRGAETKPSWMLTDEPLKWPGTSKVIKSYLAYHQEQENELSISKEKDEKLRLENSTLLGESERLNTAYSELMMSKQSQDEERELLNGRLERLRNFVTYVESR